MLEELKTISQSGIRKLLKERLENPEKYVGTPLLIWRSDFRDGIQDRLLRNILHEYNEGKEKDEQKWFLSSLLGDENQTSHDFSVNHIIEHGKKHLLGIYVIEPVFAPVDYNHKAYEKYIDVINQRKSGDIKMVDGIPVVAYMCHTYDWFETPEKYSSAEQYIFKPDFEEWVKSLPENDKFLGDFIRKGNSPDSTPLAKKELEYRWYNYFNNNHQEVRKGCDYPECWHETLKHLRMEKKLSRLDRFSEIDEQSFILAFSGISYDLAKEFREYIIKNKL